ncbi:hypothetical protein [Cellulomonas iranensis]|uniref:hypothetical protein n=1 Tax=Cellulomonas iranensis TaxID=76862 RepID=UPI003D7EBC72
MTTTDDALVTRLRTSADAQVPPMALDPASTMTLGRRRRRRASAVLGVTAVAAGALVSATVLVGGGAGLPPASTPVNPAGALPDAGSETPPAADLADLAPALDATRAPAEWVRPGGDVWWTTGIAAGASHLVLGPASAPDGSWRDIPFAVATTTSTDATLTPMTVAWHAEADLLGHGPSQGYDSMLLAGLGTRSAPVTVALGAVPAWMPGARVALALSYGVPDAAGDVRHVYEVPTYADPTGSGATLFSVVGDGSVVDLTNEAPDGATVSGAAWFVFVDDDGSAYVNGTPVTREQLGVWLPQAPLDEVVDALRAMGAAL